MKHITFADKSLLAGDELADVLVDYAATLADNNRADSVTFSAIGADGDEVEATYLLNSGTNLVIETSNTTLPEPENSAVVHYMQQRIDALRYPKTVQPQEPTGTDLPDFDFPAPS